MHLANGYGWWTMGTEQCPEIQGLQVQVSKETDGEASAGHTIMNRKHCTRRGSPFHSGQLEVGLKETEAASGAAAQRSVPELQKRHKSQQCI